MPFCVIIVGAARLSCGRKSRYGFLRPTEMPRDVKRWNIGETRALGPLVFRESGRSTSRMDPHVSKITRIGNSMMKWLDGSCRQGPLYRGMLPSNRRHDVRAADWRGAPVRKERMKIPFLHLPDKFALLVGKSGCKASDVIWGFQREKITQLHNRIQSVHH